VQWQPIVARAVRLASTRVLVVVKVDAEYVKVLDAEHAIHIDATLSQLDAQTLAHLTLHIPEYLLALGLVRITVVKHRVTKYVAHLFEVARAKVNVLLGVEARAAESGLHGEAVHDAHVPHDDAARSLCHK